MKPRFCLLDAGPIIELHRLGVWNQVVERAELAVSLEVFLDQVGLSRKLPGHFRCSVMTSWVEEGRRRFITGEGLR